MLSLVNTGDVVAIHSRIQLQQTLQCMQCAREHCLATEKGGEGRGREGRKGKRIGGRANEKEGEGREKMYVYACEIIAQAVNDEIYLKSDLAYDTKVVPSSENNDNLAFPFARSFSPAGNSDKLSKSLSQTT